MRVAVVRKKYPELFAAVQSYVWTDLERFKKALSAKDRRVLSYNAATISAFEHHRAIRKAA